MARKKKVAESTEVVEEQPKKKRKKRRASRKPTSLANALAGSALAEVTPAHTVSLGAISNKTKWIVGGVVVAGVLVFVFRKKISKTVVAAEASVAKVAAKVAAVTGDAAFKLALPDAGKPYADDIIRVANEEGLSPFLLAGFMEQESGFGMGLSPKGPTGTGDAGHGHGLMQIDDRSHAEFLLKRDAQGTPLWQIPYENLKYATKVYKQAAQFFKQNGKGKQVVVKSGDYAAKNGVPAGTYPDPRPLQGDALVAASIAAYNTGAGNVIKAIAAGKPPDATTTGRKLKTGEVLKYTTSVLARVSALTDKAKAATA